VVDQQVPTVGSDLTELRVDVPGKPGRPADRGETVDVVAPVEENASAELEIASKIASTSSAGWTKPPWWWFSMTSCELHPRYMPRPLRALDHVHGSMTTFIESGAMALLTAVSTASSPYRWDTNSRNG
jgi:hypothetical protein